MTGNISAWRLAPFPHICIQRKPEKAVGKTMADADKSVGISFLCITLCISGYSDCDQWTCATLEMFRERL